MTDDASVKVSKPRTPGKAAPISATYDQILKWIEAAKEMPEKPERKNEQVFKGKAIVELLYDVTKKMRSDGYTFDEIVAIYKTKDGVPAIKAETFKTYYNHVEKERAAASAKVSKTSKKDAAKNAAGESSKDPVKVQPGTLPRDVNPKPTASQTVQETHHSGTTSGGLQEFDVSRPPRG
jgi:hypothetical protein